MQNTACLNETSGCQNINDPHGSACDSVDMAERQSATASLSTGAGAARSMIWPVLGLLLAASLMGIGPIFVRLSGVSAEASAFWRAMLAAPVFLFASQGLAIAGGKKRASNMDVPNSTARPARKTGLLVLAGVLFAADLMFAHLAIGMTTVANAILLNNLAPLFVGCFGLLGWARRPSRRFWQGLPIAMLGAFCLFLASSHGSGSMLGDATAIVAAGFYGTYFVVIAKLRQDHSALQIMLWSTIVTAIILALYMLVFDGGIGMPAVIGGWLALCGLAFLTHIGGQGMVSVCFKRVDEATGSIILLWQPFMSAILGALVLGEVLNPWHAVGAALVMVAVAYITVRRRRRAG
ncbi:DMT family transporter [Thalassospira sp. TSL5-1]|uniref:DMT family transporter n=1 Tax=Thalassospira sp. TSL5-1 TaxID=1544451 RepID=UPI000A7FE14E|nr:DMT family transporter [Thalassospira sp. TSL5-1]